MTFFPIYSLDLTKDRAVTDKLKFIWEFGRTAVSKFLIISPFELSITLATPYILSSILGTLEIVIGDDCLCRAGLEVVPDQSKGDKSQGYG
jgi:hypothetical protein